MVRNGSQSNRKRLYNTRSTFPAILVDNGAASRPSDPTSVSQNAWKATATSAQDIHAP